MSSRIDVYGMAGRFRNDNDLSFDFFIGTNTEWSKSYYSKHEIELLQEAFFCHDAVHFFLGFNLSIFEECGVLMFQAVTGAKNRAQTAKVIKMINFIKSNKCQRQYT